MDKFASINKKRSKYILLIDLLQFVYILLNILTGRYSYARLILHIVITAAASYYRK
jgi:hypothetical protein